MKLRRRSGQATVEFAFAMFCFAVVLVMLGDVVKIGYSWLSLQYCVSEAARIGSVLDGASTRQDAIEDKVIEVASGLGLEGVTVQFFDSGGGTTAGLPQTYFRLEAQDQIQLNPVSSHLAALLGNRPNSVTIHAETMVRNEPYR